MNKSLSSSIEQDAVELTPQVAWEQEYRASMGEERPVENVSGIPIKPLYGPEDWQRYGDENPLSYPGQADYTRGIYDHASRADLDAAPVDRPWNAGRLQCAAALADG
jgi:methylmalonyl-CoA mutase, N-terminal domain